mmetsp:Transcript_6304/g.8193  ORF Transcript_6304/g.8193 Transcript_6304/m.8193 type:complete len:234 (-) Transcript_6304:1187-1888(-)
MLSTAPLLPRRCSRWWQSRCPYPRVRRSCRSRSRGRPCALSDPWHSCHGRQKTCPERRGSRGYGASRWWSDGRGIHTSGRRAESPLRPSACLRERGSQRWSSLPRWSELSGPRLRSGQPEQTWLSCCLLRQHGRSRCSERSCPAWGSSSRSCSRTLLSGRHGWFPCRELSDAGCRLRYQASITSPVVLAKRTFLSPSMRKPTRVALPFASSRARFDSWIGRALGRRPPWLVWV